MAGAQKLLSPDGTWFPLRSVDRLLSQKKAAGFFIWGAREQDAAMSDHEM